MQASAQGPGGLSVSLREVISLLTGTARSMASARVGAHGSSISPREHDINGRIYDGRRHTSFGTADGHVMYAFG